MNVQFYGILEWSSFQFTLFLSSTYSCPVQDDMMQQPLVDELMLTCCCLLCKHTEVMPGEVVPGEHLQLHHATVDVVVIIFMGIARIYPTPCHCCR